MDIYYHMNINIKLNKIFGFLTIVNWDSFLSVTWKIDNKS